MTGRRRLEGEAAPTYGPDDDDEFSVEVHHNGFFCGHGKDRAYLDGKVDWFDNVKVQYWSFNAVEELCVLLGYDLGVPVWWLLPEQDMSIGLRLIASDEEAQIMKQVAFKVKNYVLYLDHYHTVEYILEARELPILSMLQRIKGQLMARHYNKQKEVQEKWGGMVICPKIRKKLARHGEMANTCYVIPSGSGVFEVHDREWQFNVDIPGKHCDCNRWSLTGIPCSHAISCLRHERIPEESVLPWCYTTEAFKQAYGSYIHPCNDKSTWEKVGGPKVEPPKYEKKPGRPAKVRRKSAHEVGGPNGPRLTKHGLVMHCSHCGETTHNARTCERKKAGEPAVKKTKKTTTTVPDQQCSKENETYQEVYQQQHVPGNNMPLMSTLENPMVSQMQDEADQAVRQTAVSQPTPDSAYINYNLPAVRHMPLTTASKIVRATRVPAEKKKNAAKAKSKSKPKK